MAIAPTRNRDVRLALVLNGGVSLAVWIGGVTEEIDSARRAEALTPDDGRGTQGLYAKLLNVLRQDVVVDVIGGASAGGINGVLLGAAIYNSRPLPNLREIWISLGDFRTLLRPSSADAPPSLMRGDEVVLPELRRQLSAIFAGDSIPPRQDLYVYAPATDLFGFSHRYSDSTGRAFKESDHRRVFTFTSTEDEASPAGEMNAMRPAVWLGDPAAAELLARAARSSSSFPFAFEAHCLEYMDEDESSSVRWLVDGGILDNQPFNPVLNQIAVIPAARPVKRVVMYVVPYVTEVSDPDAPTPVTAPALATISAALSLPRDLPKLQGLERITRDQSAQRLAQATRSALRMTQTPEGLAAAAEELLPSYKQTRVAATRAVFEAWADPDFKAGPGALGQTSAWDNADVPRAPADVDLQTQRGIDVGTDATQWVPLKDDDRTWSREDPTWNWGLSPAERVAAWALMTLAETQLPDGPELTAARTTASWLIHKARSTKTDLVKIFRTQTDPAEDPIVRAIVAYGEPTIVDALQEIQTCFAALDANIADLNEGRTNTGRAASVQECLDVEIIRNAFGIQEFAVPIPFEFVMASAGIQNALGHLADTPEAKLAGMKLNHFGGFLKRSWRANDWLWGRLDGVEHLLRALLDTDRIIDLEWLSEAAEPDSPSTGEELAVLAFALEPGATETSQDKAVLLKVWQDALTGVGWAPSSPNPESQFAEVLARGVAEPAGSEESERFLSACRRVVAARFQLRVLAEDLARVAETARDDVAAGASRIAAGVYWSNRVQGTFDGSTRTRLFLEMRVGEETLGDETSSRLVLDVGSQTLAVATSVLSGDRGGLPAAGRTTLGSIRKLTLALSFPLRVLAREPWLGAATFAVLVGLVVWAGTSHSTLVGATLPALALLTAIVGLAVLTLATSVFEESIARPSRAIGFLVFLGVPTAFAVLARAESWAVIPDALGWSKVSGWLDDHCGPGAVTVAVVFASVAAGLALFRLLAGRWLGSYRRTVIGLYRWAVVGTLGFLAGGFLVERAEEHGAGASKGWPSVANEHRGVILILVLLAVLLLVGLLAELVIPVVIWAWRKVRPRL